MANLSLFHLRGITSANLKKSFVKQKNYQIIILKQPPGESGGCEGVRCGARTHDYQNHNLSIYTHDRLYSNPLPNFKRYNVKHFANISDYYSTNIEPLTNAIFMMSSFGISKGG